MAHCIVIIDQLAEERPTMSMQSIGLQR